MTAYYTIEHRNGRFTLLREDTVVRWREIARLGQARTPKPRPNHRPRPNSRKKRRERNRT